MERLARKETLVLVSPADDATLMAIVNLGVRRAGLTETRGATGAVLIEPGLPPHVDPV